MHVKYITFYVPNKYDPTSMEGSGIIFHDSLNHVDVANSLHLLNSDIIGAGFLTLKRDKGALPYGRSGSLDIVSHEDDKEILDRMFNL